MRQIDIAEAAASLSDLVDRLAIGEEIALTREGKPVARLRAAPQRQTIRLGIAEGLFTVPDDFDAPLPDDVLALFYDGPLFPEPHAPTQGPDTEDDR